MISVVVPLYNKESFIFRAVNSILSQTFQDFEIVIVDDGSTDNSINIVSAINDDRIRIITQNNQGVSGARNTGISQARGEWIAFLDADDIWDSTFLETVYMLSEMYPQCRVVATPYNVIDIRGTVSSPVLNHIPFDLEYGLMTNYFEVASKSTPPICSSSVMIRKDAIEDIGGFPVGIKQGEDLLTWARLASKYPIAYSIQPLATFFTERENLGKPTRIPPEIDLVGKELEVIYNNNHTIPGLKTYIGHWHKMRASIYMRLPHMASQARNEISISLHWNPKVKNLYIYWLLLLLPYSIRMKILRSF